MARPTPSSLAASVPTTDPAFRAPLRSHSLSSSSKKPGFKPAIVEHQDSALKRYSSIEVVSADEIE